MKPSQQLVDALRRAANKIEAKGLAFDWADWRECNCGHLYRELRGDTSLDDESLPGSWRLSAGVIEPVENQFCEIAHAPVANVVRELGGYGLSRIDVACIERCAAPDVLARLGEHNLNWGGGTGVVCKYTTAAFVARYFRAQADILEEQLQPPPQHQSVQQAHPCSHMWLETTGTCLYCCASKPVVPVEVA